MASKRRKGPKERQGITSDGRVWADKRVLVNLGDYQSYATSYGLEDALMEGETARDAMRRLKEQIEDQINEDLGELDKVEKSIPKRNKRRK